MFQGVSTEKLLVLHWTWLQWFHEQKDWPGNPSCFRVSGGVSTVGPGQGHTPDRPWASWVFFWALAQVKVPGTQGENQRCACPWYLPWTGVCALFPYSHVDDSPLK